MLPEHYGHIFLLTPTYHLDVMCVCVSLPPKTRKFLCAETMFHLSFYLQELNEQEQWSPPHHKDHRNQARRRYLGFYHSLEAAFQHSPT